MAARRRPSMPVGVLTVLACSAAGLPGTDLSGLPLPGRLESPEWTVDLGDSDFGTAGSSAHDDWRVGHFDATWDQGWIAASIDDSTLTSKDPDRAPILWGTPDPLSASDQGGGRSDEITGSAAVRWHAG